MTANLDFIKTIPKTDVRFGFDLSDGKSTYVYNLGLDSTVLTGVNYGPGNVFNPIPVVQLAPNRTKLTTGRADVQYFVRANVALGAGYWYEAVPLRGLFAERHDHQSAEPAVSDSLGLLLPSVYRPDDLVADVLSLVKRQGKRDKVTGQEPSSATPVLFPSAFSLFPFRLGASADDFPAVTTEIHENRREIGWYPACARRRMPCSMVADAAMSSRRSPLLRLRSHPLKIALVGNPNVGKSVVFGRLTGRYATVSNYPGTTVTMTTGRALIGAEVCDVIDTPGVNTLEGMLSEDEQITKQLLSSGGAELVVQVADARIFGAR